MRKLLLIFAFILPVSLFAQRSVSGKIIDKSTGKPIELVAITANMYGTISNELGEFELRITSDTLFVNHISYHSKEVAVTGEFLNIILEPKPLLLETVQVTQFALLDAVRTKYFNALKYYHEQGESLPRVTYFYRQTSILDSVTNEFIECFFNGTASVWVDNLSVEQGRYAKVKQEISDEFSAINSYTFSKYSPITFFEIKKKQQYATPLCNEYSSIFDIKLEAIMGAKTPDEILIYKFTPKEKQTIKARTIIGGLLHIRTKDSTIVKFEGKTDIVGTKVMGILQKISQNLKITISYKDYEPFPIVESVKMQTIMAFNSYSREHYCDISSIMFVAKYSDDTVLNNEHIGYSLMRNIEKKPYDSVFWRNNPIIKRTPIETQII